MSDLDRLPPDQRAVLSLVLDRGRSYGEVAELLAIPESAVRDRAHAALDALANDPSMRGTGASLPPRRAAARGATTRDRPTGVNAASLGAALPGAANASDPPPPPPDRRAPQGVGGSRRAGAVLLGAIVVAIVVAVVLISTSGGKSASQGTTASSSTASTTTSAGKPSLNKTIALSSPNPELKASGTAYVLSESGRSAFYIAAQGLPPSSGFFYAVWLYNSPSSSTPLGRASSVGADGRMQGGNPLPTNANLYHQLIVTRETSTHPSHPGPIVLKGTFALH